MRHIGFRVLPFGVAVIAVLALAPAAGASITPSLSLDQSAGKAAGSTASLGLDLRFSDTGTDSPHHLTLSLPAGLLANASIDGGACLRTANTSGSACKVGSGTVTANPDVLLIGVPASLSVPVSFYLVPPPAAGDLAGLTVIGNILGVTEQLGSTGDVKVRPTGDPAGVGVTINLALPNTVPLLGIPAAQISVTDINSTFDGLRYPTTCPARPATLNASVDSYVDTTVHGLSAPLAVTGCSSLSYDPAFRVTATRDSGDRQVRLATTITQTVTQAPSRSVSLAFPTATLAPNLESIRALCLNLSSGTCQTVGSSSATSPLYPSTLTGKAYLTGSSSGLSLTLVFPAPFPLVLTGAVNLAQNAATFTGLPDIPLTNLGVTLDGGTNGLFLSTCNAPSGTATATMTDQNGDKSATVPARFTVSGCPGAGGASGGSGAGGSGTTGPSGVGGGPDASTPAGVSIGQTNLSRARFSGLRSGHPALSFKVSATKGSAKLRALTVKLPAGLSVVSRHRVVGVAVTGAAIKSVSLSHGHLTIILRRGVSSFVVTIKSVALKESHRLRTKARTHRLRRLGLTVTAENTHGKRTTIHAGVTSGS